MLLYKYNFFFFFNVLVKRAAIPSSSFIYLSLFSSFLLISFHVLLTKLNKWLSQLLQVLIASNLTFLCYFQNSFDHLYLFFSNFTRNSTIYSGIQVKFNPLVKMSLFYLLLIVHLNFITMPFTEFISFFWLVRTLAFFAIRNLAISKLMLRYDLKTTIWTYFFYQYCNVFNISIFDFSFCLKLAIATLRYLRKKEEKERFRLNKITKSDSTK